jgi:hypothetical protein
MLFSLMAECLCRVTITDVEGGETMDRIKIRKILGVAKLR